MVRRRTNGPKKPRDWHLWNEVARTINPLPDKRIVFPSPDLSSSRDKTPGGSATGKSHHPVGLAKSKTSRSVPRFYSPPWSPGKQTGTVRAGSGNAIENEFLKPTIEPRMHRRVRRGQVPIDADIDLHGMRQHEARAALSRFILARAARGNRTVLVITGKGLKKTGYGALSEQGVLRHLLPRWLNEADLKPFIAGWEVSARHHGGEGAFYVRLRVPKS